MIMSREDKTISFILVFLWWTILFFEVTGMRAWYITLLWMAFGLVFFICKKRIEIHFKTPLTVLIFFFVFTFLSTLINYLCKTGTPNRVRPVLFTAAAFVIPSFVVLIGVSNVNFRLFFKTFRVFVIVSCLLGIYDFATKNFWYEPLIRNVNAITNFSRYCHLDGAEAYRLTLLYFHPIYYSVFLFVFIAYAVFFPLKNVFLQCLEMMLLLFNLILTHGRTGMVVTGAFFLYYSVRHRKELMEHKKKAVLFAGMCIIAAVILVVVKPSLATELMGKISSRMAMTGKSFWGGIRTKSWTLFRNKWAESSILQILFGGGYSSGYQYLQQHPIVVSPTVQWSKAIDNQYLTFLMDFGLVGTLIFLSFVFSLCRSVYHAVSREEEFLCCAALGFCISGLTYEFVGNNIVFYLFLILLGMLVKREDSHAICLLDLRKKKL